MKIRARRDVRAVVAVQPDPPAIVLGFGAFTVEASVSEALVIANQLADAIAEAKRLSGVEWH
jgi:hypothetical protein